MMAGRGRAVDLEGGVMGRKTNGSTKNRSERESLAPAVNAAKASALAPGKSSGNTAGVHPKTGGPSKAPAKKYKQ
jgi:hypothetical protein